MKFKKGDILRCVDNSRCENLGLEVNSLYKCMGYSEVGSNLTVLLRTVMGNNEDERWLTVMWDGYPTSFYRPRFEKVDPSTLTRLERILWSLE